MFLLGFKVQLLILPYFYKAALSFYSVALCESKLRTKAIWLSFEANGLKTSVYRSNFSREKFCNALSPASVLVKVTQARLERLLNS